MDSPSENDRRGPGTVTMAQRNLSLSDDESLADSNMDEYQLDTDIPDDDDDDQGSSSELSVSPFEQADFGVTTGSGSKQSSDSSKETLPNDAIISDSAEKPESSQTQSTRSSGRLRKEKVPNQRKNLFPGRPRVTNRGRKFPLNPQLSEPLAVPFKSPSSSTNTTNIEASEPSPIETSKLSLETLSNTDDGNSSEVISSALTTPDTSLDANSSAFTSQDDTASAGTITPCETPQAGSDQKLASGKRRAVTHPGKMKGKLGNRKKAFKLVEYRRKRGTKSRFKSFTSPTVTASTFPSNLGANASSQEADSKQDDSNENKIIICNSKDLFVLSQDVCIMCGSLGADGEGRLLSCSQCGQCYHPVCAGVTKVTKIMLKKGWRCLECTVCEGCGKPTDESRLLLCDDCDISYHTYCLDPPLENVPPGTWKCQWCVICVKCHSTTPGFGSQWQANYTLCGPCASQENCSLCQAAYTEKDLIIQCSQCTRWLHSKCDSMDDEDECEIASCIGFSCIRCRPADQLPPHIQANKNGTLRSLLNKKRSEEKQLDPTSSKKSDIGASSDLPDATSVTDELASSTAAASVTENGPLINTPKLSKYQVMDGIFLSEQGFSFIKDLTKEQPKKKRAKRRTNLGNDEQADLQGMDENSEEKANDLEGLTKTGDERKGRQRRLEKLGIGGFTVKQRGRLSCNKEDDELNPETNNERSNTPEGDKPKRRRRITKKHKSQLQESFPSYMQEAFFGKGLLDTIHGNNNGLQQANNAHIGNEIESEEEELDSVKRVGKESIIELSTIEISSVKSHKPADLNDIFDDNNFTESLDDLPPDENYDDLSPDNEMLMDILINNNLENNDEELDELTNGGKIDDDVKDDMDILNDNFNFNDIVDETGLPQMDSKEVEDLFNEVMSDSSIQQQKDFQMPPESSNQMPMMTKPIVEPLQLPNIMHQKVEMPPAIHQTMMNSAPTTPISNDPFASCRIGPKGPMEPNIQPSNMATPSGSHFNQAAMSSQVPESVQWQNNEIDNETATQGQKNFLKWETEEALGLLATISPVLYANTAFPDLKSEYPVWSDRLKQISKLWRQLSTDARQPFLQKARENRAASRIQKSQSQSSDSYGTPAHPSSLPSTPQPPSSPQLPAPSPLNDIYARSPATPRSAPVNTQVRPSFDESFNQRQMQPDLYSPTNTSGNYPPQPYMQPSSYGMNEGFGNNSVAAKGQMRPNVPPVPIRPNISLRRTVSSDPYARQPMTPMPGSTADPHSHNYVKPDENANDPMSKQQLRNLLQVQQIRRQDSNTPQPRPPNWTVPDNGFRQPLSPAMARNRMPVPNASQYSMESSFRYPTDQQRMMMPRGAEMRFRPMTPVPNQHTSPRSVNSPLGMNVSGPGTPLGMGPSTPQSPAITSPSSLMQNSPMSGLHSPASMLPPSPIHHSPMPTIHSPAPMMSPSPHHHSPMPPNAGHDMGAAMRPQIVQEDNNPFNDAYLQKEKQKQQQQFPIRYPQQMPPQQMHSPGQQLPGSVQSSQVRVQPQQAWNRMPMPSPMPNTSTADMNPMMNPNMAGHQGPQSQINAPYQQHNFQQVRSDQVMQTAKPESKNMQMNEGNRAHGAGSSDIVHLPEDLPGELGDNDDLLDLGDDFNILEYADDELQDKTLPGQSGKNSIFDEFDEKDMLQEKKGEDKSARKEKGGNNNAGNVPMTRTDFNQGGFNPMNTATNTGTVTSGGQNFGGNKPNVPTMEQSMARQDQGFFGGNENLRLSDDDFERLKMDFLNDSAETSNNQIGPSVQPQMGSSLQGQHNQPQGPVPHPPPPPPPPPQQQHQQVPQVQPHHQQHHHPQMGNLSQQPLQQNPQHTVPPHQAQQFHQQPPPHQQPHGPPFVQSNQGQPMWQDPQHPSVRHQGNFANRMHLRMPMSQSSPIPRHLPPAQAAYSSAPNRMMMHHAQQQQQVNHMHMPPVSMGGIRHPMSSIQQPPQPPSEILSEHDRQTQHKYEQWLIQQNNFLTTNTKYLEGEMAKLRKMKKSLNAKQRQCRKNQSELSEQDSNELAHVTADIHTMQKNLEQARKLQRQHSALISEYKQKYTVTVNLPHSPGAPTVQTSPRSVNSPLAAMSASGPGTPLGMGPTTPQSPSITSPSPSSLMQNSPMSALHSPAPLMPPSPIHHSPMPPNVVHDMVGAAMRPQIVQEDNNPFSDVYLQKEKKQHMQQQQSPAYSHQMSAEMTETRQLYTGPSYGEEGPVQQYYHSQQTQMSYQMNSMRPQSHAHYPPPMSEPGNFPARFNQPVHGQPMNSPQYNSQQQINYQQIRRPPPPPYPGNPQHFNARPYQGGPAQIRPPMQKRSPQDCMPMRMQQQQQPQQHQMYNESNAGGMMPQEQFAMTSQVDQHMSMWSSPMDSRSMNPIVGEAKTTMEFNMCELGPGHDNQSDPVSFLQEQANRERRNEESTEDNNNNTANSTQNSSDVSSAVNAPLPPPPPPSSQPPSSAAGSQEYVPLQSFNVKHEHEDTSSNSNGLNEEFDSAQQSGQCPPSDDNQYSSISTDENLTSKQEQTKNNALLKQLLQNCPSADAAKEGENQASNAPVVVAVEKDVKFENVERSSCQHEQQQQHQQQLQHQPHQQQQQHQQLHQQQSSDSNGQMESLSSDRMSIESNIEMDTGLGESMNGQNILSHQESSNSPSAGTTPHTERKMTYLDIRRAQLERDPTPPPEEKPKRKRTLKRKESKSIDESFDNTSNQSGSLPTTPKTKKRVRKGSQNRVDESVNNNSSNNNHAVINNNNNEHYEHMLANLVGQLRTFPQLNLVEPTLKPNMSVCTLPDAPDFNSNEIMLRGSFGNASLSHIVDYYTTYPFGPLRASSVLPSLPPAALNNNTINPGNTINQPKAKFYIDEFGFMKNFNDLEEHVKVVPTTVASHWRDTDSPETVVSCSSPEPDIYEMPPNEYNSLKYINDDTDEQSNRERDCGSPILFIPVPVRPTVDFGDSAENDKENRRNGQSIKPILLNGMPLKDSGNVNITLMLPHQLDIRNVLISLAKLLRVTQPLTCNVNRSPKETEIVKIEEDELIDDRCKFCEEPLEVKTEIDSPLKEYEFNGFCTQECADNHNLISRLGLVSSADKDESSEDRGSHSLGADLQNDGDESEVISIFEGDTNEFTKTAFDFEGINIDEKRWKNTRYMYWSPSSFKEKSSKRSDEEDGEEAIERELDRLAICLRPAKDAVETRVCLFCHQVGDGESNGPSRLLNYDVDKWVHLNCALWSYDVYEMLNGALMHVDVAYQRALTIVCVRCERVGASLKCFKLRCANQYHFACAIKEKCFFNKDKTVHCPQHSPRKIHPNPDEMTNFAVSRRVFINRDEQKQIGAMIEQGENRNLLRIGSLIFMNIGQLLPHQLANFHTSSYIYPIGYKISRFYWSFRRLAKRCQYICSIGEREGKPEFSIEIIEDGYENVTFTDVTPKLVWQKVLNPIMKMREESQTIKVFSDFISGEDLFGLTEPAVIRILESLPGVDTLPDYNFKYGRSPWYELPLAINPTGCARTEPHMRTHFKRPHLTLHASSNVPARSSFQSSLSSSSESSSPYVKTFVHSKVTQYRKMKQEWRSSVKLARSRISGLGLYATKDIEKHTMIIEYIGLIIRNEVSERNERDHIEHNRGIYFFRLDDNRVIDATLSGGLARYVNHSCDPNCVTECVQIGNENKILIIANRRIQAGEELTYDYKFEFEDDHNKIPCSCGAANCRKWMN